MCWKEKTRYNSPFSLMVMPRLICVAAIIILVTPFLKASYYSNPAFLTRPARDMPPNFPSRYQ
jgi:hypothetical protein